MPWPASCPCWKDDDRVPDWIAGGATDMRRGMNTLALTVQQGLGRDPHAGEIFCFRGRKGDLVKLLWHDGVGVSLYPKRLEAGKFIWPSRGAGDALKYKKTNV
ncbi:IS66 family insertion sequence element accessory protein TnpB [Salipiger sp. PrR007]|uniref:IS66 family insertion sequence element accessory protein TnpB n=1 Tax=Salipiger sp. PrR007 TaxID=2706884 RepID=UPI002103ED4A|nr:IS66 family insertion sequence element accessory protein TnpB [Salipiger sp. PrR007]